jgi:glyoxylase-like metal-dependent hydrolase (beta-lactamase superfamily II)
VFDPVAISAFNPGPITGEGNHTYLISGANGRASLIDAGTGDERHVAAVEQALAERGAQLAEVLVTHAHGDHASGAPALARRFPSARFRKHLWPAEDGRYPVDWRPIVEGERVRAGDDWLTAIHTPGHSPDHLAFWHEPSGTLFSGDLAAAGTTIMIVASKGGDLIDYLASLRRIRELGAKRLLPSHGPEIRDPDAILSRYLEHRARREQQVIEAVASGLATVPAITESIYHGLPPALVRAAAENVRAHLEKLRRDGRVVNERDTWSPRST